MNPIETLDAIVAEVRQCERCELHRSRKQAVPGEGPADAAMMLIGEGPGFHENEQGRPFVGAAGNFLEELLALIGMTRQQVFIANVVKCRPPSNRDPQPEELQACGDYLDRQIEAINPRVIVTLGRYSMQRYFPQAKISSIHGQAVRIAGRLIVPMYHPAAALHRPSLRAEIEQDFAALPGLIEQTDAAQDDNDSTDNNSQIDAEQLSMF